MTRAQPSKLLAHQGLPALRMDWIRQLSPMRARRPTSVKKVTTVLVVPQQLRLSLPLKEEVNAPLVTIVPVPLLRRRAHPERMFLSLALLGPTAQIREERARAPAQPAPQTITVRTTDPPRTPSVTKAGSVRAVILHQLPTEDSAP